MRQNKRIAMSELAEFARELHESALLEGERTLVPVVYPSRVERLFDVRAVICDVYGTLINYRRDELVQAQDKETALLDSFRKVAARFRMDTALSAINPVDSPEKTLRDFYHGLITLRHDQAAKKGIDYPEIRIEEVWALIITLLKRHGYAPEIDTTDNGGDLSRKIAWFYNFNALGRRLYPDIVGALQSLKANNIIAGLLSNGQFYTPLDLTLLLRDQSGGSIDDMTELFDPDLTFFSYEYLAAKPDKLLFRRLYDALYEFHILPEQAVFVGNDLTADIAAAQEAGMKTALFTGDDRSVYLHDKAGEVIPDITFTGWAELSGKLSFHSEGQA
jgi:putative hydrolase of the HAD superfamily